MAAVRYGDEKDWERVQALYRKVEMQEEKIRLMRALVMFFHFKKMKIKFIYLCLMKKRLLPKMRN